MNRQNKNYLNTQDRINIARKNYNNEIVRKTMEYQKQYGFELNPRKGHELWNVEGDAFKHAFMAADMALKLGQVPSLIIGIDHENQTPNNPKGEWNMDSWNNRKGREIAKEIQKEYGNHFNKLSQQQKDNIIAEKIMKKMQNGELITKPDDSRKFYGIPENAAKLYQNIKGISTGGAAPIQASPQQHAFTPEEIGKMSPEEFNKNEAAIMEQVKNGQIVQSRPQIILDEYTTPEGAEMIFTKEDLDNMSTKEFTKHEKTIWMQMKKIGIPSKNQLPKNTKTYSSEKAKNSYSNSKNGKWVTINGNHVFIED